MPEKHPQVEEDDEKEGDEFEEFKPMELAS